MKRAAVALTICIVTLVAEARGSVSSSCQLFLKTPNERTLAAMSELAESKCWAVINSSNTTRDRLNRFVGKGNRWAAQVSARHLNTLAGGNLEDALVALGQFGDHDMQRLFVFANRGLLSERQLTDTLTMLPLSLSDNAAAQLQVIRARRDKAIRVSRKDLLNQRRQAVKALDTFAAEIRSKR